MEAKKTFKVVAFGGSDLYKEAVDIWYDGGSEDDKRAFVDANRDYGLTVREFDTEAERKAYLQGIDDAEGYLDVFIMPEKDYNIL